MHVTEHAQGRSPPMNALSRLLKAFSLMGDAVSQLLSYVGISLNHGLNGQEVIYTDPVRTHCSFPWGSCKGRAVSMEGKREEGQDRL